MFRLFFMVICASISFFAFSAASGVSENTNSLLPLKEVTTKEGAYGVLAEREGSPIVRLQFIFKGGAFYESKDELSFSSFYTEMLSRGSGKYEAVQFEELSDERNISLTFDAGLLNWYVTIVCSKSEMEDAIKMVKLALNSPRFDKIHIEDLRQRHISSYKDSLSSPSKQALSLWQMSVFKGATIAQQPLNSIKSIEKISRDDLLNWHKKVLSKKNVKFVAAGDISTDEVSKYVDDVLIDLPEIDLKEPAKIDFYSGKKVYKNMDVPQTAISFGGKGLKASDPDFIPLKVGMKVLGMNSFESRLMREIRVKRGLVYGIYFYPNSYFIPYTYGKFSTADKNVKKALAILKKEILKVTTDGITYSELDAIKKYIIGKSVISLSTTENIFNKISSIVSSNLPYDYFDRYITDVKSVTLDQVNSALKKVLKVDNLTIVAVGKSNPFDISEDKKEAK